MNINLNAINAATSPPRIEHHRKDFSEQRQSPTAQSSSNEKITITPELLTGDSNVLSLGMLILGGEERLKSWRDKGLEITEDSIRHAFHAFNQAFKEQLNTKNGSGLAVNSYQIIENSQDVPSWFIEEKGQNIRMISDPILKSAFKSGELYHISIDSEPNIQKIRNYQSIANF
tara:strand:- start:43417 stop:43935 length:519 start_codon:yes stop_codon:yes gene_type:complete